MTTQSPLPPAPTPTKQLMRDPNGSIGGVCSGVAHYFDVDVVLVRILFLVFVLTMGTGVLLYLIGWLIIPESPVPLHHAAPQPTVPQPPAGSTATSS